MTTINQYTITRNCSHYRDILSLRELLKSDKLPGGLVIKFSLELAGLFADTPNRINSDFLLYFSDLAPAIKESLDSTETEITLDFSWQSNYSKELRASILELINSVSMAGLNNLAIKTNDTDDYHIKFWDSIPKAIQQRKDKEEELQQRTTAPSKPCAQSFFNSVGDRLVRLINDFPPLTY